MNRDEANTVFASSLFTRTFSCAGVAPGSHVLFLVLMLMLMLALMLMLMLASYV